MFDILIDSFRLIIRLRIKRRRELSLYTQSFIESFLNNNNELRVSI